MMNNLSIYPSKQGLGWVFACQDGLFGKNHMQNADLCIKNVAWGWVRHMTSKICRIDVNKKIFDVGISHSNPVSVLVLAIRQSQQKFSISKIDLAAAESSVYAPHSEKTLLCAQHPIYKYIGRVTLSPIIFISGCVGGDEKKSSSHQPKMIMFLVAQTDLCCHSTLAHKLDGLWVVMMASCLVAPSHTSLVGLRAVACATSNSPDG